MGSKESAARGGMRRAKRAATKASPKKGAKTNSDKLAVSKGGVRKKTPKRTQKSAKGAAKIVAHSAAAKKRKSRKATKSTSAVNYDGVELPSAEAARAVSTDKQEKQAQRMALYRRRGTMERRVHDFFDKVGGSALLVTTTSGGAQRPGRRYTTGAGIYGDDFLSSPLHDRLSEVFKPGMDWRLASMNLTMRDFLVRVSPHVKKVSNSTATVPDDDDELVPDDDGELIPDDLVDDAVPDDDDDDDGKVD